MIAELQRKFIRISVLSILTVFTLIFLALAHFSTVQVKRTLDVLTRTVALTIAAIVVFALSRNMWLSLVAAFFIGFGITITNISINTLCQTTSSDDCRSRVISLYIMCTAGVGPVGGLVFGAMADILGGPWTLLFCAAMLFAFFVLFVRQLHPIHHSLALALRR